MTIGMATVAVYRELWPGAGFETGDLVKETLGGALVEIRQTRGSWC